MRIERINSYAPNFNARFVCPKTENNNSAIEQVTKHEVEQGRGDEWRAALSSLDKVKRNVRLSMVQDDSGNLIVHNLYNDNDLELKKGNYSKQIMRMSSPFSKSYKDLFIDMNKEIDAANETEAIRETYYDSKMPDYKFAKENKNRLP